LKHQGFICLLKIHSLRYSSRRVRYRLPRPGPLTHGRTLGPGERPAAVSSTGPLHAGRKQPSSPLGSLVGSGGELRHASSGFLMGSLSEASGKAIVGTQHWLVG